MDLQICPKCFCEVETGKNCPLCSTDDGANVSQEGVLPSGTVLGGKYQLGRLLGRGGFGATYLAWDINLQVRIAIKEFLPRQLGGREQGGARVYPYPGYQEAYDNGLRQFLAEAQNIAKFRNHAGIISVLDFFPENNTGYMVMEYLDGTTLEQYIEQQGRIEVAAAVQLMIPVADALRACHAAQLIHRDISPDNIFLTADRTIKLLDFGAARYAVGMQSTNLSVILKEGFAPFEQYQRNGLQGPWTDVYALTATLYRLITGDMPVTAPDRIGGRPLPPPSEKGVMVSKELQAVLDKGMALQATARYQTVDDFLRDLQSLPELAGRRRPPPPPTPPRRSLPTGLILGGGILGAATVVAVIGLRFIPQPAPVVPPTPQVTPAPSVSPQPSVSTTPSVTPAPKPPPIIPPSPGPPNRSGPNIEAMIDYVDRTAQNLVLVWAQQSRLRTQTETINRLKGLNANDEAISGTIAKDENLRARTQANRDSYISKYVDGLEWLAGHDPDAVDGAIKIEYDKQTAPHFDTAESQDAAKLAEALRTLTNDLRAQREQKLTREAIIDAADRVKWR